MIRVDEVASTMELAHEAAAAGAPHGTAFVAARQQAGRGSRGRVWASERGGLWCSIVARPRRADAFAALSLRAGLAVAEALESLLPLLPSLQLKWPNDLLAEGRKLAGILCEASWSGPDCRWVVVGLGINVRNALPVELAGQGARCDEWAPTVDLEALLAGVLPAVTRVAANAGPLDNAELAAFLRRDALAGRRVREPVQGVACGVAPNGSLLVRNPAGHPRPVLAGLVLDPS